MTGVQPEAAAQMLDGLHDIVLPAPIGWMPQTVGWYVVFGVLLLVVFRMGYAAHRHRQANRYRELAIEELALIEHDLRQPDIGVSALCRIPRLLKRVALSAGDRTELAALTGDAWLGFLDRTYGGTGFSQGAGRLLTELAYASPDHLAGIDSERTTAIVELARTWIRTHDVVAGRADA